MSSQNVSFFINGVGAMGKGLAHQIVATPGATLTGISDIEIRRAVDCCGWLGLDYRVVKTSAEADAAIAAGLVAVAGSGLILAGCATGEIFFEASSAIGDAARIVMRAMDSGMHPVMMNAEADFTFGALLAARAAENAVIYSSADGDQYGALKRLADEVTGWGFDLVMFGNIKGYLDRRANPTSVIPEADVRNLDYCMCAAFTDGTKLNIEMAIVANVCRAQPTTTGMLGPRAASVAEILALFRFAELWDGGAPLVDYVLGAEPNGGVFLVGHSADPYRRDMMRYYKMGEGPFYVFYRPYHLCHFEAVPAALQMLERRQPLMQPVQANTAVTAYAKIPLASGTMLDGVGGYTCYGLIEPRAAGQGLPICLGKGARLTRPVAQDERITLADVAFEDAADFALYEQAQAIAVS